MSNVVVGLDVHLKNTQGTIMKLNGEIVKQEKFTTCKESLKRFLGDVPIGSKVALESLGFCWPWIDYIEKLGYEALLANPVKAKCRAEDVKTDKVDSEVLAHLTRMDWLPTCYVPNSELRWLRSLLRHRAFRKKMSTALKNRTRSEMSKRDIRLKVNLGTKKGRKAIASLDVFEVVQNIQLLEALEKQTRDIEAMLRRRYGRLEPVQLLMTVPGVGFLSAVTLYAEICDVKRFSGPEKLAHYAGLVPSVHQSADHAWMGRETKGNKWLKWLMIEVSWAHVHFCPEGRLARVFEAACRRKGNSKDAIKVVARKLVNVVWAVWTYGQPFMVE